MANTARASTLSPLHLQLIGALAGDAAKRGLLTDPAAARAFIEASPHRPDAPATTGQRKRRDCGHDLPRTNRATRTVQHVATGIEKAGAFAESWAGIACGFVFVAVLAWHRWPVLEAMT